MGPTWLQSQFPNWDFTTGWRDPLWTAGIALGGGMAIGRWIDTNAGRAFAIAGTAVAIIKAIRIMTAQSANPLFPSGGVLGADLMGSTLGSLGYDADPRYRGVMGGNMYSTTLPSYASGETVGSFQIIEP